MAGFKTRRRSRVIGVATTFGACLAFGMTPLSNLPTAHADDFGLGDLIGNLLSNAVGDATAGAGAVAGDTGQAATQAALELSTPSFDHAFAALDSAHPLADLSNAPVNAPGVETLPATDLSSSAASQAQTDGLLPISTTGSWLTNSDGQVVIPHGLNEVYKVAPYEPAADGFSNNDAAFLAANGFDVVRLGVIWSAVEPQPGVYDTAYLDSIQQTVQTLANHGIYTILDFHQDAYSSTFGGEGAPAWAVETGGLPNPHLPFPLNEFFNPAETHAWNAFWTNADAPNGVGLEDDYSQMLGYVANDFNGNPDVLGIEIMNEPSTGSHLLGTLLGSKFFDTKELTPFYNEAASAIRAADPSTTIFFEPNVLFDAGVPTHLGTVDVPNTVFSFHDYCEIDLGGLGCLPSVDGIVGHAEKYADAHNIPAFMTEFGATSNQSELAAPMDGANQNLVGWTEWAYTGQGDITTSAHPPSSESLVYDPTKAPVGDNVNTANLETLAEPYPQVISGTPNSWSFDNGTFQFSYSTEEADGLGSFPAGSQTTISVPSVEFPGGYHVSVTGGEVVSGPNAPELVIASNSGASTVSVTVSPAG